MLCPRVRCLSAVLVLCLVFVAADVVRAQSEPEPAPWVTLKEHWWEQDKLLAGMTAAAPERQSEPVPAAMSSVSYKWTAMVYQGLIDESQPLTDKNWEIYYFTPTDYFPEQTLPKRLTYHPASDTQPKLNLDASRIVFVSDRDGNAEIYAMAADGQQVTRLTTAPGIDTMPDWSPDGQRIAFVSDRAGTPQVYSMTADGIDVRPITGGNATYFFPAWSPNGAQLAMVQEEQGTRRLWIVNADGSGGHAITGSMPFLQHPVWSRDGMRLLFDYDADNDTFNELGLINADGSGYVLVRDESGSGSDPDGYTAWSDLWAGTWSVNGGSYLYSKIVYGGYGKPTTQQPPTWTTIGQMGEEFWPLPSLSALSPDLAARDPWAPVSRLITPTYARRTWVPITWLSGDRGISGNAGYAFDHHLEGEGWYQWDEPSYYLGLSPERMTIAPVEGNIHVPANPMNNRLYVRVRAQDHAGNQEPWVYPQENGGVITLYQSLVTGRLTDNRGMPLAHRSISTEPPALAAVRTDSGGTYAAMTLALKPVTIDGTKVVPSGQQDVSRNLYLMPETSIRNGGFELDLSDWMTSSQVFTSAWMPYAGEASAVLSVAPCDGVCLDLAPIDDYISPDPWWEVYRHPQTMIVDKHSNVHFVSGSIYRFYPSDGETPTIERFLSESPRSIEAQMDPNGTIHVFWEEQHESGIHYIQRTPDGIWTGDIELGGFPFAVGADGILHAVYEFYDGAEGDGLGYRARAVNGQWSERLEIGRDPVSTPAVAVADDGTLHVAWCFGIGLGMGYQILYRVRTPAGVWGEPVIAGWAGAQPGNLRIVLDKLERPYVFWQQQAGRDGRATFFSPLGGDGNWPEPQLMHLAETGIPAPFSSFQVTPSSGGGFNLVGQHYDPNRRVFRSWTPEQGWGDWQPWSLEGLPPDAYVTIQDVELGQDNLLYAGLRGAGAPFAVARRAVVTETAALTQPVQIPAEMHAPTLAFMYRLEGTTPAGTSWFEVSVTDAVTTTALFSATREMPWALEWADLSAWAGQTVSIAFAVHQAAGDQILRVRLDEVSLGSWLTPVLREAMPGHIAYGAGAVMQIKGENFLPGGQVRLGDQPLEGVRWVDANTLEATVPSQIKPGVYDLVVTNPQSAEAYLPNAVAVGHQIYVPAIRS